MDNAIILKLKEFIKEYPINEFGGVKRFLKFNKDNIDILLTKNTLKKIINNINLECGVNISYINSSRILKKLNKNDSEIITAQVKKIDFNKTITQQKTMNNEQEKPVEKKQELDIDLYSQDKKELRDFLIKFDLISDNPMANLILKYNLNYNDLKEANMIGISSRITLNQNLTSYCMRKFGNIYKK